MRIQWTGEVVVVVVVVCVLGGAEGDSMKGEGAADWETTYPRPGVSPDWLARHRDDLPNLCRVGPRG